MLENNLVLLIVLTTSAGAYLLGRWGMGTRKISLGNAVRRFVEYLGAFVIFLMANMVLGVALIVLIRWMMARFVLIFFLDDVMLMILSVVGAFVFFCCGCDLEVDFV